MQEDTGSTEAGQQDGHDAERDFYASYWRERPRSLNRHELRRVGHMFDALATVVPVPPDPDNPWQICDLGCGTGWFSNELTRFGEVTGVDLSPDGVELARERWPAVKEFVAHDILAWDPGRQFDLVLSSEVIEHVLDKAGFRDVLERLTKPGGYTLITTPNGKMWPTWLRMQGGEQIIEDWITPRGLRALLKPGFEVVHHETFYLDFAYVGSHRVMSAPKLLRFLSWLGLGPLYDGFRLSAERGLYQLVLARRRD